MDKTTLIYLLAAWFASNAMFPLVMKSIERQYAHSIDSVVSLFFRATRMILLGTIRVLLMVLFFPTFLSAVPMMKVSDSAKRVFEQVGVTRAIEVLYNAKNWPLEFIQKPTDTAD